MILYILTLMFLPKNSLAVLRADLFSKFKSRIKYVASTIVKTSIEENA